MESLSTKKWFSNLNIIFVVPLTNHLKVCAQKTSTEQSKKKYC